MSKRKVWVASIVLDGDKPNDAMIIVGKTKRALEQAVKREFWDEPGEYVHYLGAFPDPKADVWEVMGTSGWLFVVVQTEVQT